MNGSQITARASRANLVIWIAAYLTASWLLVVLFGPPGYVVAAILLVAGAISAWIALHRRIH